MKNPAYSYFLPVRKILCATDFSAASYRAFHAALQLCTSLQASLTILNALECPDQFPPTDGAQLLPSDDALGKDSKQSLHALVQEAQSAGVVCKVLTSEGPARSCIAEAQLLEGIDLVVLGIRPIHGFKRLMSGSTVESVLSSLPCPVLSVGTQSLKPTFELPSKDGVVLFATDFHSMTTDALCYAASFAAKLHLRLHCLHVLPRGVQNDVHGRTIPLIIMEGLQHLASKLNAGDISPVCAVTYGSEISNAVVEYARVHNAKLIVLGVRRASLLASHIHAHIVYRIITEAPCAVMTIAHPAEPSFTDSQRSTIERAQPVVPSHA